MNIRKEKDGTYRYRGLCLLAAASDGTYWVSGLEKWMSISSIDKMLEE